MSDTTTETGPDYIYPNHTDDFPGDSAAEHEPGSSRCNPWLFAIAFVCTTALLIALTCASAARNGHHEATERARITATTYNSASSLTMTPMDGATSAPKDSTTECGRAAYLDSRTVMQRYCEETTHGGRVLYYLPSIPVFDQDMQYFECYYGMTGLQVDPVTGYIVVHQNAQRGMSTDTIDHNIEGGLSQIRKVGQYYGSAGCGMK